MRVPPAGPSHALRLRSLTRSHNNEHGNDLVFYSAVEPDSLIAVYGLTLNPKL